jgi:hypothetical protein
VHARACNVQNLQARACSARELGSTLNGHGGLAVQIDGDEDILDVILQFELHGQRAALSANDRKMRTLAAVLRRSRVTTLFPSKARQRVGLPVRGGHPEADRSELVHAGSVPRVHLIERSMLVALGLVPAWRAMQEPATRSHLEWQAASSSAGASRAPSKPRRA